MAEAFLNVASRRALPLATASVERSRRDGLIVWESALLLDDSAGLTDETSGGIDLVVTTWVTALEKNFSSTC